MCSKRASDQQKPEEESSASALKRFKRGQRAYHGRMRRQQHTAAQLEHEGATREPVPTHPLISATPPQLITAQADLEEAVGHIRQAGRFAYDTEFIGELTYYPRLCVVQLATTQRVMVVDPLTELDLRPVWQVIADPQVQTLVHAGQQDLEPVARNLGSPPENVMDTQIAAGFIGLPYPLSLRELIRQLTGANVNKGATFTEWDRRPLAPMQLEYAADDVRYLPAAWEAIQRQLEARGHADWARAECDKLCRMESYAYDLDAQVGRVKGGSALSGRKLAVLRQLVQVRDQAARQQDVPARSMMRDEVLVGLAKRQPTTAAELHTFAGLPRPVEQAYGGELLEAVQKGQQGAPLERDEPRRPEPPAQRVAIDSLWALIQSFCHSRGIDPALVANRHEVRRLLDDASAPGRFESGPLMQGWRGELVGKFLTDFLKGRKGLLLRWHDGRLGSET